MTTQTYAMMNVLSRRAVVTGMAAAGLMLGTGLVRPARSQDREREMLFNDPAAPLGGNGGGALTIVTFFDYNCPFCRRASHPLDAVVKEDGDIRLVYKDWPILSEASVTGASLALAAHRQDRYEIAHHALMSLQGRADEAAMRAAVERADLDKERLDRDMRNARPEIEALLARNHEQAEMIGLRGTPAYIIGPFLLASALDEAGFRQVIKDARQRGNE